MNLTDIRNDIFARRPEFKKIVETWGDKTLLAYYSQGFKPLCTPSTAVLDAIEKTTAKVLGAEIGIHAREAIALQKWVNTADHHGLLHNPYFYTAALARSSTKVRKESKTTVTLPFGGVSLSNDSFPRGFSFHDQNLTLKKVFFKSLKERRLPVYALAPMHKTELEHEKERCFSLDIKKNAQQKLQEFFEAMITDSRVWSQDTFSAQLTVLNSIVWKELFSDTRGDFVYIQIDDVANELLLSRHLVEKTEIHSLLFESSWRELFVTLYSGIAGAHTENTGTHFFWYIDYKQETRRRLLLDGAALRTHEGDIAIELVPERIAQGLQKRELMPSTALMLIMLVGVEKLACGGGPSQLQYLSSYMQKWKELKTLCGLSFEQVPLTSIWCADNTLFQVSSPEMQHTPLATLIDVLLYESNPAEKIDTALATTTLEETFNAMAPTLYTMYTKQPVSQDIYGVVSKINL